MSTLDAHQSPLSCPTICYCVLFLYLLSERAICLSLSFPFFNLLIMTTIPFLYFASLVNLLLSISYFVLFRALLNIIFHYISLKTWNAARGRKVMGHTGIDWSIVMYWPGRLARISCARLLNVLVWSFCLDEKLMLPWWRMRKKDEVLRPI